MGYVAKRDMSNVDLQYIIQLKEPLAILDRNHNPNLTISFRIGK